MAREINLLLAEINAKLEANLSYSNNVFHCLAVLQPRDGKTWPMTRLNGLEGNQISPEDTKSIQYYHRVLNQVNQPIGGKGIEVYRQEIYTMRLVGIGYRPPVTNSNKWNNPDLAREVMKILGERPVLSEKELVLVEGQAVTDKLTVLNEEYQNNDRIKKDVLRLVAFAITYTIKQRVIGNDC